MARPKRGSLWLIAAICGVSGVLTVAALYDNWRYRAAKRSRRIEQRAAHLNSRASRFIAQADDDATLRKVK